jgi:hypothetical protein
MTSSAVHNTDALRSSSVLLSSESQDEFASLCADLEQDLQPKGVIERNYVRDFANITWEIQRLGRYKTSIINNSRLAALQGILKQLLYCPPDADVSDVIYFHAHASKDLAHSWFDNKRAQARVAKLLRKFQMDEGAIEAEAFRLCADDLERLDRMLALAEVRRDKALRNITEYRDSLSKRLQQCADRILENDEIPRLIAVGKRLD